MGVVWEWGGRGMGMVWEWEGSAGSKVGVGCRWMGVWWERDVGRERKLVGRVLCGNGVGLV